MSLCKESDYDYMNHLSMKPEMCLGFYILVLLEYALSYDV